MAFIISLALTFLFLSGCSSQEATPSEKERVKTSNIKTPSQELEEYRQKEKESKNSVPSMILPPVYEDISVFDNQKITFSAENADLHKILYSISKIAGLNLIIDKDVNHTPITLSVQDANLDETLDIIMDISGAYYTVEGNILHVKEFMRKRFNIPYVHSSTSFDTSLGGDTLGSAMSGGSSSGSSSSRGIKGNFQLSFKNPEKSNDFYEHLENNIKDLISDDGKFTLNRFSGTLSVYDKKKNIIAIENLLKDIKEQCSKSVLIEAKLLEVTLNDGHQLGVSWEAVANSVANSGDQLLLQQTLSLVGSVAGTVKYSTDNFSAVVKALDSSGDVETLSNPRIKVLSGQSAIISSGKLVPFWEKEVQTDQGTGGSASNTQVTYNRRDILDGITMGVTPTIMDNGMIMLNVIPITSSIVTVVDHYDETGASVASAPILNIKEAGTIINAKDNDMVLIGGLISSEKKNEEEKIPLLSNIPFIGSFFTKTNNKLEKKELVILIRLRVIK